MKSTWFGRNNGGHLCYGERSFIRAVSEDMSLWAKTEGKSVGGMTGPYRFAAGADAAGVSVSPQSVVNVAWDGRWFNLLVLIVLLLTAWYQPWRWPQRRQSNSAKVQPAARANA